MPVDSNCSSDTAIRPGSQLGSLWQRNYVLRVDVQFFHSARVANVRQDILLASHRGGDPHHCSRPFHAIVPEELLVDVAHSLRHVHAALCLAHSLNMLSVPYDA